MDHVNKLKDNILNNMIEHKGGGMYHQFSMKEFLGCYAMIIISPVFCLVTFFFLRDIILQLMVYHLVCLMLFPWFFDKKFTDIHPETILTFEFHLFPQQLKIGILKVLPITFVVNLFGVAVIFAILMSLETKVAFPMPPMTHSYILRIFYLIILGFQLLVLHPLMEHGFWMVILGKILPENIINKFFMSLSYSLIAMAFFNSVCGFWPTIIAGIIVGIGFAGLLWIRFNRSLVYSYFAELGGCLVIFVVFVVVSYKFYVFDTEDFTVYPYDRLNIWG